MRINRTLLPAFLGAGIALAGPSAAQETPSFCQIGFAADYTGSETVFSMMEIERMLEREFRALDSSADGRVTLEEFRDCHRKRTQGDMLPRNVSATGSGELDDAGLKVEIEALVNGGTLGRADYMAEAQRAFDATGNEEDNQLEWARTFILLFPNEEIDVRSIGRSEYAARAAALFHRLDIDGNGRLTSQEWAGDGDGGERVAMVEAAFGALDGDQSGDVTAEEYATVGTVHARAAREAAIAAGWEDNGDYAAGLGTDETGNVVANRSEGLVEEGTETQATDEATASEPSVAQPPMSGDAVPVFYYFFHE